MKASEPIHIRRFCASDAEATAALFFDAVQNGAKEFYTQEQRNAWAPDIPDIGNWLARLDAQTTFIASQDDQMLGFMTMTKDGMIDLAFVRPDAMGSGVSTRLYDAVLSEAKKAGLPKMQTEASYLAKKFFEKHDWKIVQQQTIIRHNVALTNFLMEKTI